MILKLTRKYAQEFLCIFTLSCCDCRSRYHAKGGNAPRSPLTGSASIRQRLHRIEPRSLHRRAEAEENPNRNRHGKRHHRTGDIRGKDHLKLARLKDGLYQEHAQASAQQHPEYPARQAQRRRLNQKLIADNRFACSTNAGNGIHCSAS